MDGPRQQLLELDRRYRLILHAPLPAIVISRPGAPWSAEMVHSPSAPNSKPLVTAFQRWRKLTGIDELAIAENVQVL